jgi:hypothetical protein
VTYESDPTNANIKLALPVETQLLDIKNKEGNLSNLTTDAQTDLVSAINEVDAHADANATAIAKCETLVLSASSVSALPYTFTNSAIETDMVCINSVLSNPSAQLSDWTVNTDTAGSCVVSGTISGTTDIKLYLMKSR